MNMQKYFNKSDAGKSLERVPVCVNTGRKASNDIDDVANQVASEPASLFRKDDNVERVSVSMLFTPAEYDDLGRVLTAYLGGWAESSSIVAQVDRELVIEVDHEGGLIDSDDVCATLNTQALIDFLNTLKPHPYSQK